MKRFSQAIALLFVGAVFGVLFQEQLVRAFNWLLMWLFWTGLWLVWPFLG